MAVLNLIECPVSVNADIQELALEISARNDRYTPESGHYVSIALKDR